MSEQTIPPSDDLRALLAGAGADAYVLAYADPVTDPVSWDVPPPLAGMTGAARSAAELDRAAVQEVCRGRSQALRRWLQLEDGQRQLAIIAMDGDELREYTPGDLAAALAPAREERVPNWLGRWLVRRYFEAPPDEEAWTAVAAAWTCHMRALADNPPPAVLSEVLDRAGEDQATRDLVTRTGLQLTGVLDRMEWSTYRQRSDLVEDWHTLKRLSAGVPTLTASADWLLDQVALRDANAMQLRAVLEPDITDHLHDLRRSEDSAQEAAPALDAQRTEQLAHARDLVRAYTATSYSGREREADDLFNAFAVPTRTLEVSDPARLWRQRSVTARGALAAVEEQWLAVMDRSGGEYRVGPERRHAGRVYLSTLEAQQAVVHDALGRADRAAPVPPGVPEGLREVAAHLTVRRVADAFGSLERARTVLDGQIAYLRQEPIPAHRREETAAELALLEGVRSTLEATPAQFDQEKIQAYVDRFLAERSAQPPAQPDPSQGPERRIGHAPVHTVMPQPGTGGMRP
ncbi:hypothetical protein ABZ468_28365 [Streptomyces sp. NPDC005708]|uniref:hypothetical protein n=1 Tax=Streptomyces sp. NPDC005708 TaxID=3154564 RepID=UPI0033C0DAFD